MTCRLEDASCVPRAGSLWLPIPSCPYSPDGYLYEREAILEYILHQKKEIARQMKVMGMGARAGGFDPQLTEPL